MKEYRKGFSEKEVKILKRVDLLCDALEIDHLGLTNEALKKLMNDYNNIKKGDKKKPFEFVFNDPCQPCKEVVECNECPHAHPELVICKCQHERAYHKNGIGECSCGCKSFELDTFSGIERPPPLHYINVRIVVR